MNKDEKEHKIRKLLTLRMRTIMYLDTLRFQGVESFDAKINELLDILHKIDIMIEEAQNFETED
jgi:hypothetical protein